MYSYFRKHLSNLKYSKGNTNTKSRRK